MIAQVGHLLAADDRSLTVLQDLIAEVKHSLEAGLEDSTLDDLAFIGNASSVYEWAPCPMVDLDAFLFVQTLDQRVGTWLVDLRERLTARLRVSNVSFELRIVDGPYKPSVVALSNPIIVAHLGVFTNSTYEASPALKRWAWRKYQCRREVGRLKRLAPPQPTMRELLYGPKGVEQRLRAIETGRVQMRELVLPTFEPNDFFVTPQDANFLECCFAYAANSARNHARVLSLAEPDQLGNQEFFAWYHHHVLRCDALLRLMEMKANCRQVGFTYPPAIAQTHAGEFLSLLCGQLSAQLETEGNNG